jgi:orotidine-5'-phosphate decarboxylase
MEFSDRLYEAIAKKQSRLVVGLDPHIDLLPPAMLQGIDRNNRAQVAEIVRTFCLGIVEATHDLVAAVKPQVAFFERLGPEGFRVLEDVVAAARACNLLTISDCKRGDIGSTAAAYAEYHLGSSAPSASGLRGLGADCMTLNAYLGEDSLAPFSRLLREGRGFFLLAKSSNKGSADLQDRMLQHGEQSIPVYWAVAQLAQKLADNHGLGQCGYSSVGIVVGATFPVEGEQLRAAFPRLLFLVPGIGAQGASGADIRGCFDQNGFGAVANASRSVLFAFRENSGISWQSAARNAATSIRNQLNAAVLQT